MRPPVGTVPQLHAAQLRDLHAADVRIAGPCRRGDGRQERAVPDRGRPARRTGRPMNDPTPAPVDFFRDQWGRPLVVPAGGDRPRPYTRSSSAAKTIEDTYNLEMWARRNVAFGMARDT